MSWGWYTKMELPTVIPTPKGATQTMLPAEDRSILDGLRDLDPQVIGAVYDRFYPQVYRYVLYRIGNETVAEDLASDVFVRLLEAIQQGRGPQTNIKAWLISTASHVVTDHLRRHYRRPVEALSDALSDGDPQPQVEFDLREQNRLVRQALSRLTPEQQHVLALRFGQGYSLEETANMMRKNVNAVKALQFRALAALQRQIGEVWND